MASNARNQARWRERVTLKAAFFNDMDQRRADTIRQTLDLGRGPEHDRVREYLLNHPSCWSGVVSVGLEAGAQWCVLFDGEDDNARTCAAVALAALRSISSLPCFAQSHRDGSAASLASTDPAVEAAAVTVSEMQDLGMWGVHA